LFISFFRYSEVGIPLEYFCHNVPFPWFEIDFKNDK
jgi:hypothetical protein